MRAKSPIPEEIEELISRHLDRIGDHATNIADDVIFMVSARDVRHHAAQESGTRNLE